MSTTAYPPLDLATFEGLLGFRLDPFQAEAVAAVDWRIASAFYLLTFFAISPPRSPKSISLAPKDGVTYMLRRPHASQ